MILRQPYKVIVAEDEEIVRAGLELLVDSWSEFQVVGEAKDGKEALEKVELIQPDIVLMDVGMPRLDGIQATHLIRSRFPDIRITMMTSYTNPDTVFASLASGAHGYCIKGSSAEKLKSGLSCTVHGDLWVDKDLAGELLKYVLDVKRQVSEGQYPGEDRNPGNLDTSPAEEPEPQRSLLTTREMDVLKLIVDGKSNSEISTDLEITLNTVKTHIKHIFEKLSATDRTQAAVNALKRGVID